MGNEQQVDVRVKGTRIIGTGIVVLSAWELEPEPMRIQKDTGNAGATHSAIRSGLDFGEHGWYGRIGTTRPNIEGAAGASFNEQRVQMVMDHYKQDAERAYQVIAGRFPPLDLEDESLDGEDAGWGGENVEGQHRHGGEITIDLDTWKGLLAAEEEVERELLDEAILDRNGAVEVADINRTNAEAERAARALANNLQEQGQVGFYGQAIVWQDVLENARKEAGAVR